MKWTAYCFLTRFPAPCSALHREKNERAITCFFPPEKSYHKEHLERVVTLFFPGVT